MGTVCSKSDASTRSPHISPCPPSTPRHSAAVGTPAQGSLE